MANENQYYNIYINDSIIKTLSHTTILSDNNIYLIFYDFEFTSLKSMYIITRNIGKNNHTEL